MKRWHALRASQPSIHYSLRIGRVSMLSRLDVVSTSFQKYSTTVIIPFPCLFVFLLKSAYGRACCDWSSARAASLASISKWSSGDKTISKFDVRISIQLHVHNMTCFRPWTWTLSICLGLIFWSCQLLMLEQPSWLDTYPMETGFTYGRTKLTRLRQKGALSRYRFVESKLSQSKVQIFGFNYFILSR